jgi:hypothetical protein
LRSELNYRGKHSGLFQQWGGPLCFGGKMMKTLFVVLVHADRAPLLLGSMSVDARAQTIRELRVRHPEAGLHDLDVEVRGSTRLGVRVSRALEVAA